MYLIGTKYILRVRNYTSYDSSEHNHDIFAIEESDMWEPGFVCVLYEQKHCIASNCDPLKKLVVRNTSTEEVEEVIYSCKHHRATVFDCLSRMALHLQNKIELAGCEWNNERENPNTDDDDDDFTVFQYYKV
jgi:hypothetical protein